MDFHMVMARQKRISPEGYFTLILSGNDEPPAIPRCLPLPRR
jgi:hypothetical protein